MSRNKRGSIAVCTAGGVFAAAVVFYCSTWSKETPRDAPRVSVYPDKGVSFPLSPKLNSVVTSSRPSLEPTQHIRPAATAAVPSVNSGLLLKLPQDEKRSLVRECYEDLLVELSLLPEESDRFLDLIASQWGGGSLEFLEHAEESEDSRSQRLGNARNELLALLGYERFQRYEAYQSTLVERTVVRGLEAELAVFDIEPLGDGRKNSLLAILLEEHSTLPPPKIGKLAAREKQEQIQQLAYSEQRIVERAKYLLTEAQWIKFSARLERSQQQRHRALVVAIQSDNAELPTPAR